VQHSTDAIRQRIDQKHSTKRDRSLNGMGRVLTGVNASLVRIQSSRPISRLPPVRALCRKAPFLFCVLLSGPLPEREQCKRYLPAKSSWAVPIVPKVRVWIRASIVGRFIDARSPYKAAIAPNTNCNSPLTGNDVFCRRSPSRTATARTRGQASAIGPPLYHLSHDPNSHETICRIISGEGIRPGADAARERRFCAELLRIIDAEASRFGVSRQAFNKIRISDALNVRIVGQPYSARSNRNPRRVAYLIPLTDLNDGERAPRAPTP
jgi:hypothetical protein